MPRASWRMICSSRHLKHWYENKYLDVSIKPYLIEPLLKTMCVSAYQTGVADTERLLSCASPRCSFFCHGQGCTISWWYKKKSYPLCWKFMGLMGWLRDLDSLKQQKISRWNSGKQTICNNTSTTMVNNHSRLQLNFKGSPQSDHVHLVTPFFFFFAFEQI